jgi:hypothetical protein
MLPRVDALREGSWLNVEPVVQNAPEFKRLNVPLHLANPADFPLHVHGTLKPVSGLHFSPGEIEHVIPPNQNDTIALELIADGTTVSIHALNEAGLGVTLTGGYQLKGKNVELPVTRPIPLDWQHLVPQATRPIILDGKLDEWPADAFTMVNRPMAMQEGWDWHGPADGHFRFAVQHRDGKIFVAVETFDDHLITSANPNDLQDRLYVHVRTSAETTKLEGIAGTANDGAVVRATPTGLTGEFVLRLPPGETTFHLNVGWTDHDRADNTKPSVLWWRDQSIAAFGKFILKR